MRLTYSNHPSRVSWTTLFNLKTLNLTEQVKYWILWYIENVKVAELILNSNIFPYTEGPSSEMGVRLHVHVSCDVHCIHHFLCVVSSCSLLLISSKYKAQLRLMRMKRRVIGVVRIYPLQTVFPGGATVLHGSVQHNSAKSPSAVMQSYRGSDVRAESVGTIKKHDFSTVKLILLTQRGIFSDLLSSEWRVHTVITLNTLPHFNIWGCLLVFTMI